MRYLKRLGILLVGAAFLGLAAACARVSETPASAPSLTFVLPVGVARSDQTVVTLESAIVSALQGGAGLEDPFPVTGQVISSPDPDNPKGSLLACAQPVAAVEGALPCILLNQGGDFIQIQAVTWQSQAFFMYRFYFDPGDASIDLSRDFVAVDVFVQSEPGFYPTVDSAIRAAAEQVNAEAFRP